MTESVYFLQLGYGTHSVDVIKNEFGPILKFVPVNSRIRLEQSLDTQIKIGFASIASAKIVRDMMDIVIRRLEEQKQAEETPSIV